MVDVYIGIGTVVTIFGVPGKYMKVYNDRSYVPGVQCGFMYEISDYFLHLFPLLVQTYPTLHIWAETCSTSPVFLGGLSLH